MQELIFQIDLDSYEDCVAASKLITSENLSSKSILNKFANKDLNVASASEKEFLLKQIINLLKSLLRKTLNQRDIPGEAGKKLVKTEEQSVETDNDLMKSSAQSDSDSELAQKLIEAEDRIKALDNEINNLQCQNQKFKHLAETFKDKEQEALEYKKTCKELTSRIVELEAFYMMKANQRQKELDNEVKTSAFQLIPQWQAAAAKIQATWKGRKARKAYILLIQAHAEAIFKSKNTQEHRFMLQILNKLKKINLTLENCFHAADTDSNGIITCEELTKFISKLRLDIDSYDLSKLTKILDEDLSGKLETQEFYEILAAYRVTTDTSKVKGYHAMVLSKFLSLVKSNDLDPEALFNSCDLDGDGSVSLKELEKLIKSLGLKPREIIVLMEILDTDRSEKLTREEFMRHINVDLPVFQVESVKSTESRMPQAPKSITAIISSIEKSGTSLARAFDLIHFPPSGKVQISYISSSFSKIFTEITENDIKLLLQTIDSSKSGFIEYKDLIAFLQSYSETSSFTSAQIHELVSNILKNLKRSLTEEIQSRGYSLILDVSSFIKLSGELFNINEEQSIELFNELSQYSGQVSVAEIEKAFIKSKGIFSEDSPRTNAENIMQQLLRILTKFNLRLVNIFKFADKFNTGTATAIEIIAALTKLVPSLPTALIQDFGKLLPASVTLRDLEILVPERKKVNIDRNGMNEDQVYWMLVMKFSIDKTGTDYRVVFKDADKDQNGKICMEEFKGSLKRCLPGTVLTYTDICMIFKAFDSDMSGFIDEEEFQAKIKACSNSEFYDKVIERIEKDRRPQDIYQAYVKQSIKGEFPILPLPIKQMTKRRDHSILFERMLSMIPSNIHTFEFFTQFKLRITSLITSRLLKDIFSLSEYEAKEIFSVIDLHNKGLTYCFVICTVLDSYRFQMQQFPVPQNPNTDVKVLKALQKCVAAAQEKPVFSMLPPLDTCVTWDNFTCLPIASSDNSLFRAAFPKNCYYYHIAAAMLNASVGMIICSEEILHNIIVNCGITGQAADYFERFSMHASDRVEKSEFIDKISRIFSISHVEADTLYMTACRKNQKKCNLYDFFTFFDSILSMYSAGTYLFPRPKLPYSHNPSLRPPIKSYFSKLADFLNKPLPRYGLNISLNYSENDLMNAFEGFDCSKAEGATYLSLLKMNKSPRIRCYHLISILDSYKEFSSYSSTELDLTTLRNIFPPRSSGLSFIKSKKYNLEDTFVQTEISQILPTLPPTFIQQMFFIIDNFNRGYIFGHQLATIIDISLKADDLKAFPLSGNPKISEKINRLLADNSRHLDVYKKTAIGFNLANKVNLEEVMDRYRFASVFSSELTENEAHAVFNSIDIASEGRFRCFYYISCIESFCRNTSSLSKFLPASPLQAVYSIALEIPQEVTTIDFFSDIDWHCLLFRPDFLRYLDKKFGLTTEAMYSILEQISSFEKPIFFYQFLSLIDVYRNCIENKAIVREPVMLPFRDMQKEINTDLDLIKLSRYLDDSSRGSCDYFWSKGIDPTELISVQEFFIIMGDLNSHQCASIFKALDIAKTGKIYLYHLLAVIETYRNQVFENKCKPVKVKNKTVKVEPLPLVISPLQDALNKLGRYFAGDNPKKRVLTSQEIFGLMDYNHDGTVTMNEFLDCLNLLPLKLTQNQIYLLLKEADLNGDGMIDYKEFTHFILEFIKKPELKEISSVMVPKPGIREMKGLDKSLKFKKNSLEDAILKVKLYIESNKSTNSALEIIFGKIDYMHTNSMTPKELQLALERLTIGLSDKQISDLIYLSNRERSQMINYQEFIDFLYNYTFEVEIIQPKPIKKTNKKIKPN